MQSDLARESERTAPDAHFTRRCRLITLCLIPLLPLIRVVEAIARLVLMPSFYDSIGHALTAEMWFSPLWWLYTSTCLGWCVLFVLVLWVAAIPALALLPRIRRRKTFAVGVMGLCLRVVACTTFRLEFAWDDRSQSEWVWCLRSRDPDLRRRAAMGLSASFFKFGVPTGTTLLAQQGLHDEVVEVRRFAASFFVKYPFDVAVPDLTDVLSDVDAQVRSDAASALAQLGHRAAVALPRLQVSLNDPVPTVRANAAQAYLAAGGEPGSGLSTLEQLVTAPDREDRRHAGQVLAVVAAQYPNASMPLLTALLRDEDRGVRFYTTLAVLHLGPRAQPLTPALLRNLTDGDYFVRAAAASVLGRIGSAEDQVVAAVLPLLKDPEWWVRRDAADALGEMRAVRAKPDLEPLLHDPEPLVRTSARASLDRLR